VMTLHGTGKCQLWRTKLFKTCFALTACWRNTSLRSLKEWNDMNVRQKKYLLYGQLWRPGQPDRVAKNNHYFSFPLSALMLAGDNCCHWTRHLRTGMYNCTSAWGLPLQPFTVANPTNTLILHTIWAVEESYIETNGQ
jgi:hypothetical protein